MSLQKIPTVLTIGGFDNIGGAGIQADLKTISELGCHGMNVLTALPVQNTVSVRSIHPIPSVIVKDQLLAVLEDIYPDVIKIGMIHTVENIMVIAELLKSFTGMIIIDPVLKSTSGTNLYEGDFRNALLEMLFPIANLVTPNLPEAYDLTETTVTDDLSMINNLGIQLLESGADAILIKGGHLTSRILVSSLITSNADPIIYRTPKIETQNSRGTGCTLAASIACYRAMGIPLDQAIRESMRYVDHRIRISTKANLGKGNGCLLPSKSASTPKIKRTFTIDPSSRLIR